MTAPVFGTAHLRHPGERVLHETGPLLSVADLATSAPGLWASYRL
ncbi:MAG TPA: hypothetical protein VFG55_07900 [Rhodanobacteraceae bacterium]|nr:hypothetical protein [Rhodanobacteraceae bacterium]